MHPTSPSLLKKYTSHTTPRMETVSKSLENISSTAETSGRTGATGPTGATGATGPTGRTGDTGVCKCPSIDVLDARYAKHIVEEHLRPVRIVADEPPCHSIISTVPSLKIAGESGVLAYDSCVTLSGCGIDDSFIKLDHPGIYLLSLQLCVSSCAPGATIHLSVEGDGLLMDPPNMMLTIPMNRMITGMAFLRVSNPDVQFRLIFGVEVTLTIDTGLLHISSI
jgi:hypothetical protein